MTAIIYRDGIMACDTAQHIGFVCVGHTNKVKTTKNGWLYGCAGNWNAIEPLEEWMESGAIGKPPRAREAEMLAISPNGTIHKIEGGAVLPFPSQTYATVGSCGDFARGCLASGKSAIQTVQLCIKHMAYIDGDVLYTRHNRWKEIKANGGLPV